MSWIALGLVVIVAIGVIFPLYLRWAEKHSRTALEKWTAIAPRLSAVVANPQVPNRVAAHITGFAVVAGCGCVTSRLIGMTFQDFVGVAPKGEANAMQELNELPVTLRREVVALIVELAEIDAHHVPVLRALLHMLNRYNVEIKRQGPPDHVREAAPALAAAVSAAQRSSSTEMPKFAVPA